MKTREPAAEPSEAAIKRKPYTAPRIEESGQFEHLVLVCAKSLGNPNPACESGNMSP
jgi:hypothetical protein